MMPTHRRPPHQSVDRGTFSGLVDSLCDQLAANGHRRDRQRLTAPLRSLEFDPEFWQHAREGLAIFSQDGHADLFLTTKPLPQRACVADRYFLMPLFPLASAIDQYDVLTLTSRTARIYEGQPEGVEAFDLGITLHGRSRVAGELHRIDIIDQESREPHRVRASSGFQGARYGGVHSKQEDIDADTERFFREVDRVVFEEVSLADRRPLFVIGLAEHAAVFRHFSKNPFLHRTIPLDPSRFTLADIMRAVEPFSAEVGLQRMENLLQKYAKALEDDRGSGDPAEIGRMAVTGRIATLIVEEGRCEEGFWNPNTGEIGWQACGIDTNSALQASRAELIGRLFEEVLLHGGELCTLPRIMMPNENGVAAIYRY